MRIRRWMYWVSGIATAGGVSVLIKDYRGGPPFDAPVKLDGKVSIVTGANSGIGYQVALGLAERGAKVYMACRERESCEIAREDIVLTTQNKFVYCRYCDLSSQESIKRFAKRFHKDEQKLDILVNNAGVMRTPYSVTSEGIETQLGVNHMGHFLLTNLLIDLLKKGAPSRVVNVASTAHYNGKIKVEDLNSTQNYSPSDAYSQSKLANVLFTRELAKRLAGTGVNVNAVHPGLVDTNIVRYSSTFTKLFMFISRPFYWPFVKSPKQGAQSVLHVALHPDLNGVTGEYFDLREIKKPSPDALDDKLALWLWLVSEKWTKLADAQKEVLGYSAVSDPKSLSIPSISTATNINTMTDVGNTAKDSKSNPNAA